MILREELVGLNIPRIIASAGIDYKSYPNLKSWVERIYARPAVKKGLAIPSVNPLLEGILADEEKYTAKVEVRRMRLS